MTTNHTKPVISLKAFADKIIDYAGLFPPASLELAQAFQNYIFYSQGEYKWMLNKFIIPAKRLPELEEIMNGMTIEGIVPLSIIGTGGETVSEFDNNIINDIELISSFKNKFEAAASIDALEVRLPNELFINERIDDMPELMISVYDRLEKTFGKNIPIFFEANLKQDHEARIISVVESIAGLDRSCGFKIRTGGVEPSSFPAAEQIAFAIMTCCEFDVPMKCTAGLHHPIKHYNEEVSSYMHGFFNVFGAAILAYTNNLDEEELLEILNDEDPYEFEFKESGFEYREIEVTNEEITDARENFILSYGSCSFDEPIADLKTMELL
ncbi:MAG: hypothetical protein K8I03_11145 [Ignavibacteria bacterium]|nr:hypothetical protein [Ignavibacteria bacterium]